MSLEKSKVDFRIARSGLVSRYTIKYEYGGTICKIKVATLPCRKGS